MTDRSDHRILRAIACYKLAKATALLLVAAGALEAAREGVLAQLIEWLRHLPLAEGHFGIRQAVALLLDVTPRDVELVGVIAVLYACLFAVEGYGLWRERHWAEYLTVIATASLIPFELWALIDKATLLRAAALLVNGAIVILLVVLVSRQRRARLTSSKVT